MMRSKDCKSKPEEGIVNLGKILPIPGPNQLALEPKINNLDADKCPRQDLKWINLTVPLAYVEYRKKVVDEFIRMNYTAQEFSDMVRRKREELLEMAHWKRVYSLHQGSFDLVAERQLKADLAGRIAILSLAEFQKADSSSQGIGTAWGLEGSDSTPRPSSEEGQQTEPLKS
jgi:hypothetical protein